MMPVAVWRALVVGAGGFVGAMARYLVGAGVYRAFAPSFPWATFLVNTSGCFAIGFLAVIADERVALGPEARLFWIAGVLGGYTTFSTFGYETILLARAGDYALAAANALGQLVAGLLAVCAGAWLARAVTWSPFAP
jgi:CrcB protein